MNINFLNKSGLLLLFISIMMSVGCSDKTKDSIALMESADYYKNLFTGEILNKNEFQKFRDSLHLMGFNYKDSVNEEKMNVTTHFYDFIDGDSTIQEFKYSIRIGNEYVVREGSYEKIGMSIPQRTFVSLDGDSIQIGGVQEKPTLLNLWFVGCTGCEQEMPSLNKLKEKYADKVNFIAITFDDEARVTKFLKKKEFNFKQIVNVEGDFLKQIGTSPYPENIFISKEGEIKFIEGVFSEGSEDYFESIINDLGI